MSESNSDSSQQQVQEQQDNRIAAAPDSINLVASRSSIGGDLSIVSTDHKSVGKSFDFASDSVGKSFDFARDISKGAAAEVAAANTNMKSISMSAMDSVKSAYGDMGEKLASAYTEAKAGEQKIMVGGALLIGAVVAITALKRGG